MNEQNQECNASEGAKKKKPKKPQEAKLKQGFSKKALPPDSTAYSSKSKIGIIPKYIIWQDSEWPELPKSDFSVRNKLKCTSNSAVQSAHSACEPVIHSDISVRDKTEHVVHKDGVCAMAQHSHMLQKQCSEYQCCNEDYAYPCTVEDMESLTGGLSALEVSNKTQTVPSYQNWGKKLSDLNSSERKDKTRATKKNLRSKLNQELITNSYPLTEINSPVLIDEDFPALLTNSNIRREKKQCVSPPDSTNSAVKWHVKKYPKKHDPILLNLKQVLELAPSNQKDGKIILRSRSLKEYRPTLSKVDTSRRVIKRGKQREFPKRKTLSKLKLAILKGRQTKLDSKLSGNAGSSSKKSKIDGLYLFKDGKTFFSTTANTALESCTPVCRITNQGVINTTEDFITEARASTSKIKLEEDIVEIEVERKEEVSEDNKVGATTSTEDFTCRHNVLQLAKSLIHSRKFREYCNNENTDILEDKVKIFLRQIHRFQTKSHFRDAEKARIHRRYALGLREAEKFLKLRKLKVLVVATDLEVSLEKGGLDEMIENMKSRGSKENIPIIFSLRRRDLAYCVYRKVPVSCMAVLNYEGAEDLYRAMIDAWMEAGISYEKKLNEKQEFILGGIHQNEINEN